MRIGYACLTVAVEDAKIKTCTLKNATEERLLALAGENLRALERMVDYNIANGISLYRISSDIVPFGSNLAARLPWDAVFQSQLSIITRKIKSSGMRVSMHPGQYTVLNSPDTGVVCRAIDDLTYHARFLDALGLDASHKIILHAGGKYGDTVAAMARFVSVYRDLDPAIKQRLVLENDGSIYAIDEVLELCARTGAPAVYDNLHNAIHPASESKSDDDWISLCWSTWRPVDGTPKTHYSQQNPHKPRGAHSETIAVMPFLNYVDSLTGDKPDIMLEVKDKNRSAVKCALCLSPPNQRMLETEWARYKYAVMERSPEAYREIGGMLRDKRGDHAVVMYQMIERALALPENRGRAVNALEHVWGYVAKDASPAQATRYRKLRDGYLRRENELSSVKKTLYRLALHTQQDYLLGSYYFTL